jgi:hypothetical protein
VKIFVNKDKNVPCCHRRNRPLLEANGPFVRTPRKSYL